MTDPKNPALAPATLWANDPLPTRDAYQFSRAYRFTRTILTRRGGAGKGLYAGYVTALFSLVYGVPAMSAVVNGLAAPTVLELWHSPLAVASLAPLTTFVFYLTMSAAAIRGPVAPAPSTVDFLATSPLPRRIILQATWLSNLGVLAAAFGIISLAGGLGLNRGEGTSTNVIFAAFMGGVLTGICAAYFWRAGQLPGTLTVVLKRILLAALCVQLAWLLVNILDAGAQFPDYVRVTLNVLTGPGGWNSLMWFDALHDRVARPAITGLVLLVAAAAFTLLDQSAFKKLRIEDLRRQARRSSNAVSAAYTGDLRSARMGLTPQRARLRNLRLKAAPIVPMLAQRDLLGLVRNPLLPAIGVVLLVPGTLLLHSAFAHAEASIFTTPLGLFCTYFGLSLLNEGSRMHADNGGRTSLWGASYRRLAFAHLALPAVAFLIVTEIVGLLALSRGTGTWLALVWLALILPVMLGMQTVSNYRGSMPLSLLAGSPTSPGSGPFMMVIWLLYPLLLSLGALWPITYFAAQGHPLLRQLLWLIAAALGAVGLARWQTGKHNRRRAESGTFLERMQAQADAAKADAAASKKQ